MCCSPRLHEHSLHMCQVSLISKLSDRRSFQQHLKWRKANVKRRSRRLRTNHRLAEAIQGQLSLCSPLGHPLGHPNGHTRCSKLLPTRTYQICQELLQHLLEPSMMFLS